MAEEGTLSASEISRRIVVGMGLVYDLYNELVGFLRMIREALENSDLDVSSITGSNLHLPLGPRKSRTAADKYMSVDMGIVFELGAAAEGDAEAEDDENDAELRSKGLQITPDSQFLAIRVLLYDRNAPDGFEPQVFAALLDRISHTARVKKKTLADKATHQFTVRRNQFLNLVKGVDGAVSEGQTLTCRVTKGQVEANVAGVVARPVAAFTSEAEVQAFVDQVAGLAGE